MIAITFDTLNMQDAASGIITSAIEGYGIAPIVLQSERLAQRDGRVIIRRSLDEKVIRLTGYMQRETLAELEALIDQFHAGVNKHEKFLDIDHNGSTRRHVATTSNVSIQRSNGLNVADFDVEFNIPSGFGYEPVTVSMYSDTNTASNTSFSINVEGSYKAEPVIELVYTAVGGGTGATVSVGNAETGELLSITRDWAVNDTLFIDSANKDLLVNSQVVEYGGKFSSFAPGLRSISYSDTLTSRTASVSAQYNKRYLF